MTESDLVFTEAVELAKQKFNEGPSYPSIQFYTKLILLGADLQKAAVSAKDMISGSKAEVDG